MGLTNFPNGASSFGMPLLGGIPAGGKHYWVAPARGSDNNSGNDPAHPLDTVTAALAKCTAGRNDTVHLIGDGQTTGSSRDTATLAWAKDATHLVGHAAPTRVSQRARIAPSTTFTPLITVSGDGCMFANVQLFQGHNAASVCANITGERNYFENVHFAGIGHATAGASAASASITLTGDGENTFKGCTIGVDTVTRSQSCSEIEFLSAAVRNQFIDCDIICTTDDATSLFLKADGAGDLDRFTIFQGCRFINAVASGSTTMTAGIAMHASAGGMIMIDDCALVGCTNWVAGDSTNVWLYGASPGETSGGSLNTGVAHTFDVA